MTSEEIDKLAGRDLEVAIAVAKGAKWQVMTFDNGKEGRILVSPDRDIESGFHRDASSRLRDKAGLQGRFRDWNGEEIAISDSWWGHFHPPYLDPAEAMKLQVEARITVEVAKDGIAADAWGGQFAHLYFDYGQTSTDDGVKALCTAILRAWLNAHFAQKEATG